MKQTILLFVFLFSFRLLVAQQEQAAEKLVAEGMELTFKGELYKALALYDKALELDKYNFFALREKALALTLLGKHDEAIEYCKLAIEKHPDAKTLNNIYLIYGNALEEKHKLLDALTIYNEGLKQFPDDNLLYYGKGITFWQMADQDNAIACLKKSIKLNPSHASSHYALGRLLILQGKNIPALFAFSRFLINEPTGQRAKDALEGVKIIMKGEVEKTGKHKFTIYYDPNDSSFISSELVISLIVALNYKDETKKRLETELFTYKFSLVCELLKHAQNENKGFYWDYYIPYFIDLYNRNLLQPFTYIVYESSGDKEIEKWLKANKLSIDEFYDWSRSFEWMRK